MAVSAILAFPLGHYMPGLGQDFFPIVDAGQIKLHLRARTGLRIEETAALCDAVEARIRQVIPAREIESIVDNIGLPYSGINLAYSTSAPVGPSDADIFIALKPDHQPSAGYQRRLRGLLAESFPGVTFAFPPADIVSQTLNFGLPSPLDVQIAGKNTRPIGAMRTSYCRDCATFRVRWTCGSNKPSIIRNSRWTWIVPRPASWASPSRM